MKAKRFLAVIMASGGLWCTNLVAAELNDIFETGKVNGNIRAYYNTREYDYRTDEGAFSLGGALRAETGSISGIKFGVGYYTAQDLGTNDDDPAKVNTRLGSDLEVLGEAYVNLSGFNTAVTLGRQKINAPLANPGDAFIIPFTFEAFSVVNTSIPKLTLQLDHINEIKNRNSEEFVDVGEWSTLRYGIASQETSGTTNLGAIYNANPLKLELWLTRFDDLFDSIYLQGNYNFSGTETIKPFLGAQFVQQEDSGDSLLSTVDSTLYGVQAGASMGKASLTLGYNTVAEEEGTFRNGAFLAPYSFSTSPIFTNNMLETFENVDSGDASKITFNYNFSPALAFKLSYATFDFNLAPDRDATDVDITYSFDEYWEGLSLRWRVEVVTSDTETVEQTNHRLQLQFVF